METSWGTMLGLSLDFEIWIKDAGWPPGCGTPDNDNAEIQSSYVARDSSSRVQRESLLGFGGTTVPKIRGVL